MSSMPEFRALIAIALCATAAPAQWPVADGLTAIPRGAPELGVLTYSDSTAVYTAGLEIAPNLPSFGGPVSDWSVDPRLPAGLWLEPTTGAVQGTPARITSARSYTVTASSPLGSASTSLWIGVAAAGVAATFDLIEANSGFALLLPHAIYEINPFGVATNKLIAVRSLDDLVQNVTPQNGLLPIKPWATAAQLPGCAPGNHYLMVRFTQRVDVASLMGPAGLTGSVQLTHTDPLSGVVTPVAARVFLGGWTFGASGQLEPWVTLVGGQLTADPAFGGLGFPGTQGGLLPPTTAQLVQASTVVFVRDTDGDLSTHETFPAGGQLALSITTALTSTTGEHLLRRCVAGGTVGLDTVSPEVGLGFGGPLVVPANGTIAVDPETDVVLEFTEAVQPGSLGVLAGAGAPAPSPVLSISFGPPGASVSMPVNVTYDSVFDLTRARFLPAFAFPGQGPPPGPIGGCGDFSQVDLALFAASLVDLASNTNLIGFSSSFQIGPGLGLVNAPVAPEAIYAVRLGTDAALSVVDLNGFGASTGNPAYDALNPIIKGNSNYPNNPNVQFLSNLIPPLAPGTCTFDGGSAGVFSLTLDSNLSDRWNAGFASVADLALGHALDASFNNGPPPFGCQAGGGNPCAFTGLKSFTGTFGGGATLVPGAGPGALPGTENPVSWAPHPNPPPLVFPPPCLSPFIGGQEPTSVESGSLNLLVPGPNVLGNPALGLPPSNILAAEQNAWFEGPSPASSAQGLGCNSYSVRQQVGHFLYLADPVANEIVVLNSNRMTVLDRIPIQDPTALATSPNLDFIAISQRGSDSVSFLSIDPSSSAFHQVVKVTPVGDQPQGLAWDPGNEDILVCNEGDGSVSIVSAFDFAVRKTLTLNLERPFEVVITPRQTTFGFFRNVYFAYILNRDGSLSMFESGPDGPNGWGYDDVVWQAPFRFRNPKAMQPDVANLNSAVWILHEGVVDSAGMPTGAAGGALSRVALTSANFGQVPLFIPPSEPNKRDLVWSVTDSVGPGVLTGVPVDLAFDDLLNLGAAPNLFSSFSAGVPAAVNGKGLVKNVGVARAASQPAHVFLAVPASSEGGGRIDVLLLGSGLQRLDTDPFQAGVQSIPADGVQLLMNFFRQ